MLCVARQGALELLLERSDFLGCCADPVLEAISVQSDRFSNALDFAVDNHTDRRKLPIGQTELIGERFLEIRHPVPMNGALDEITALGKTEQATDLGQGSFGLGKTQSSIARAHGAQD